MNFFTLLQCILIDEPVWNLYITLRKVLDIILSPALEEYSIYLLKSLVAKLNELYLKYSNNCSNLNSFFWFITPQ